MSRNHLVSRLQRLIWLALHEGWQVEISPALHLTLRKPGLPPIHTGATANDARPVNQQQSPNENHDHG